MTYEKLTMKSNEKEVNLGRALLELGTAIVIVGIIAFFANAFLGLN